MMSLETLHSSQCTMLSSIIIFCLATVYSVLAIECDNPNISAKARKRFCGGATSTSVPDSVDLFDVREGDDNTFDFLGLGGQIGDKDYFEDADESFYRPEEPFSYDVVVSTTPASNFMDDDVEYCSDLMPGFDDMTDCVEKTEPEVETRSMILL